LQRVIAMAHQGQLLREGMRVVLAGQPNTGKSSLLNALAGRESAIVTDIPGTTRDVLREEINIDGLPLHIIDTAGLRESDDAVEQEGIRRTWQEIEQADCVLLMVDDREGFTEQDQAILDQLPRHLPVIQIFNKIDLSQHEPQIVTRENHTDIWLSAKARIGIEILRDHLKSVVGYQNITEGNFIARRRHLDALDKAHQFVKKGKEQLSEYRAGELLAEDLRQAQNCLNEITGEFGSDELLGRIFSSFCIGK
jgi:tRNA modification GTPase